MVPGINAVLASMATGQAVKQDPKNGSSSLWKMSAHKGDGIGSNRLNSFSNRPSDFFGELLAHALHLSQFGDICCHPGLDTGEAFQQA
jgi:hypothetical protein